MVALNFNYLGFRFEQELKSIRHAYEVTLSELARRHSDRICELSQFRSDLSSGTVDAYECNEYGEVLYNREKFYEFQIKDAASAVNVAIQAYVVILHHFWEKQCLRWMGTREYKHDTAYKFLGGKGLQLDRNGLEKLRNISNVIKHDSTTSARKLVDVHPYLFNSSIEAGAAEYEYSNALHIDQNEIDSLFSAVASSGLKSDSPLRFG